jgi:hypothetical protein
MTAMRLEDRAQVGDSVIGYATSLDRRDWSLLRSLMADEVHIDYTDFAPELDVTLPADEWVTRVTAGLSGFDGTQHLSTNHVFEFNGDTVVCISQMQAAHFLTEEAGLATSVIHGYYTTSLKKSADQWLINGVKLTITATLGDTDVYARAAQLYMEKSQ